MEKNLKKMKSENYEIQCFIMFDERGTMIFNTIILIRKRQLSITYDSVLVNFEHVTSNAFRLIPKIRIVCVYFIGYFHSRSYYKSVKNINKIILPIFEF